MTREQTYLLYLALALVILLFLIWFVPYLRKRRRFRPINMPAKASAESIRQALAIDIDNSPITMPEAKPEAEPYYLLIDTETYNPVQSSDEVEEYHFSEPIALSWQVLDAEGNRLREYSTLIRQDKEGQSIPNEAVEIHGITQDMMMQGISPQEAYKLLNAELSICPVLVAHNLNFHLSTLCEDMKRHKLDDYAEALLSKQQVCTMQWGRGLGFKTWGAGEPLYPRLDELFGYLYYQRMHLPLSYKSKTLRDVRLLSACLRYKLNSPLLG